ncbi:hypothetical protein I350_07688 [Cryptococcus amylolentus CBS 6273]|uniref:ENTH domain-containing protein n=1 Tax=Cryptococcus amylolentus CBS 6273 TaxID=1296118 RepID=A0A1E3JD61_9TREE|nr:hypothetical protein I350_07688 [Cryptococcus amylolentus CBS 6273]
MFESLAKQASQITMYDVKSYYEQAKNAVLNISEMEAKVREATNDDPWGASSTLMLQIAEGAQFNEIMPCIYSRFMEKEAREWRQIYKALTLLEFLVKNGSERVVDDARAHISTIKMLRSFHYVDEKSKDQGINGMANEIALLLGDVDRIRVERRKAKANRNKYQGGGNDGGMSFVTSSGSRYGGFGSDSLGGGGGSGSSSGINSVSDHYRSAPRGGFNDSSQQTQFDEYEGADDFDDQPPPRRTTSVSHRTSSRVASGGAPPKPVAKEEKKAEKPKEVNLFDFDDEPLSASVPAAAPAASSSVLDGDFIFHSVTHPANVDIDDFDDFQSAAPTPAPTAPKTNNNVFDLLNSNSSSIPTPTPAPAPAPSTSFGAFTSPPLTASKPPTTSYPSYASQSSATASQAQTPAATSPKPKGSTFDDLFASSLSSLGKPVQQQSGGGGKTIKDLEKEKMSSTLWGAGTGAGAPAAAAPQAPAAAKPAAGGNFDDLLL